MIDLEINESLWFAENQESATYLELKSIGLPIDQPKVLSQTLSGYIGVTTQYSSRACLY